jgi:hypothetical protein
VTVAWNRNEIIAGIFLFCACGLFEQRREGNRGGLCSDAGGDEIWGEAGALSAQVAGQQVKRSRKSL